MKQMRSFVNKRLHKNKKGGIEGLPLQLMVIIIIATLGLSVMIGWMNGIEEPHSISEVESKYVVSSSSGSTSTGTLTVYVYDQDGNPLKGAEVVVSGLGCTSNGKVAHATTGDDGRATMNVRFSNVNHHGFADISVSKTGYGSFNDTVLVTA